ncbi:hypothetical protein T439DRAFT_376265 [Meredithblackwellia eburnea MCA 4105]
MAPTAAPTTLIEAGSSFEKTWKLLFPDSVEVKRVRISPRTKMETIISQALAHLVDPTKSPIALHSLPFDHSFSRPGPSTSTPLEAAHPLPDPPPTPITKHKSSTSSSSAASSVASIPKLVSIVEIIKRSLPLPSPLDTPGDLETEIVVDGNEDVGTRIDNTEQNPESQGGEQKKRKRLKRKRKGKGSVNLHQYTRVGALEELDLIDERIEGEDEDTAEERKRDKIALDWLESGAGGTKRPKRKHTPFMVVILSARPLPALVPRGFSYQPSTIVSPTNSERKATAVDGERDGQKRKRRRKLKEGQALTMDAAAVQDGGQADSEVAVGEMSGIQSA